MVILLTAAGSVVMVLLFAKQLVVDDQTQNLAVIVIDHALGALLLSIRLYVATSLFKAKLTGLVHRLLETVCVLACSQRQTSPVADSLTWVFSNVLKLLIVNSCVSLLSTNRLLALVCISVTSWYSLSLA